MTAVSTIKRTGRVWWLPALILGIGVIGAGLAGWALERAEQARARADFNNVAEQIVTVVRLDALAALDWIEAARAFWLAVPDAGPRAYHVFVDGLPGVGQSQAIRALALLPRVPSDSAGSLYAALKDQEGARRALGYPAFRLWPDTDQVVRYPAVLVEPAAARAGVLGYDMATNPERRAAGARAVAEGRVISSAPVALTQDAGETRASVLLVAPLMLPVGTSAWWIQSDAGAEGADGADGSLTHVGFVAMGYSPSLALEAHAATLTRHGLSVVVWDGGAVVGAGNGAPASAPAVPPPTSDPRRFYSAGPAFAAPNGAPVAMDQAFPVSFAGRQWWVGLAGSDALRPLASRLVPVALAGALLVGAIALTALAHRLLKQQALLRAGVANRTHALTMANMALMESRVRAEAASAAKSQFMAAMNHELRTPLNAILGFAEMIRDGIGNPQGNAQTTRTYADHILSAGGSLLSQINRVLDLSRMEAHGLALIPEPVDGAALAREMVALLEPTAAVRRVRLVVSEAPETPLFAADPQALRQILDNLVSNAIKFSPPGAQVVIRLAGDGDGERAVLQVIDSGIGIPAEQIERVTEAFHQVADQMTRAHEGLGLGLAIVKDLVNGMGGSLGIDSALNTGTTITVSLPSAQAPKHAPS